MFFGQFTAYCSYAKLPKMLIDKKLNNNNK